MGRREKKQPLPVMFELEGKPTNDEFYAEIRAKLCTPENAKWFGNNLDAMVDVLRGGHGLIDATKADTQYCIRIREFKKLPEQTQRIILETAAENTAEKRNISITFC